MTLLALMLASLTVCVSGRHVQLVTNGAGARSACVCVPFWLCKEDFSGHPEDIFDLVDLRYDADVACAGEYDACCTVECGKSRHGQPNARISPGGSSNAEAGQGEFPWMLGVLQNRVFKCGASLVHPQIALTAAHCVSKRGAFKIRGGEHDWKRDDEAVPHQDRMSKKVVIHPNYEALSLQNDIALIILDEPFDLTENVGIVCLPEPNAAHEYKRCTASGWGKNSFVNGVYQSSLKKVQLNVIPRDLCTITLQNFGLGSGFQLHPSFLCAGGSDKRDTCKGDGGGPLVSPADQRSDRYEQIGIVSWGLTCGMQNSPGVYVDVALYADWITEQITTLSQAGFI